ncbi:DoxX family protein [Candidatus Pacebacteria bacterium]|nr:DoxX family protein [Candidatus Paceibacterota bacterium]
MKRILFIFIAIFFVLNLITPKAEAHVRYLVDESAVEEYGGLDNEFLLSALLDIGIILLTFAGILLAILIATKVSFVREKLNDVGRRADGYSVFAPWMLRLSLGIALIGSGTAQTLISPVLEGFGTFATLQILLGFLVMSGFLVVPAAIVALGLYIFGLMTDWYLIGNLDFAAISLALIFMNNEKPGVDDLLGIEKLNVCTQKFICACRNLTPLILRLGLGSAMMFLAVYEKILNPHLSELIVTGFGLVNVIPVSPEMWVLSTGIIEFVIGLAIFFGIFTRISSAIAFVVISLSFFYFGEDVSSHITLFGALSVLFITQGGAWSVDKKLKKINPDFV